MRIRTVVAALAIVAVAAAGCGSKSGPGVATAGGGAAVTASPTATPGSGDRVEQLRQFAQCMRDHGVDMPDPQPGAGIGAMAGSLKADDPAVQAAFTACQSTLPNGGQPPKLNPQQVEQYRVFAGCMREHGIDLPDPAADGTLPVGQMIRFMNDPALQKALEACRDSLVGVLPSAGVRGGNS